MGVQQNSTTLGEYWQMIRRRWKECDEKSISLWETTWEMTRTRITRTGVIILEVNGRIKRELVLDLTPPKYLEYLKNTIGAGRLNTDYGNRTILYELVSYIMVEFQPPPSTWKKKNRIDEADDLIHSCLFDTSLLLHQKQKLVRSKSMWFFGGKCKWLTTSLS